MRNNSDSIDEAQNNKS